MSSATEAFTERFVRELAAYGRGNDPSQIGKLRVFYREWLGCSSPGQRKAVLDAVMDAVQNNDLSTNALLPFVGCEPDRGIASTSALNFGMLHPRDAGEAMLGVNLLVRGITGGTMNNPGAVFGGLLSIGDVRVSNELWGYREQLDETDLDELSRVATGRLSIATISFLLQWLDSTANDEMSWQFNRVAAALVNQRTAAAMPFVAVGGRVWPVWSATAEEEEKEANFVPIEAFLPVVQRRLAALRDRAPEPEVVEFLMQAWMN